MTINERVSDERLAEYAAQESDLANKPFVYEDSRRMARELQQYRAAAEPVAWMHVNGVSLMYAGDLDAPFKVKRGGWTPLYAAPQVTSVPECYQRLLKHAYGMTMGKDWNKGTMAGHHREKLCKAVEDCRAAMLTAAPAVQAEQLSGNTEQVSQPTLPLDYLQGYKDGCEWAARMAEANHPQTGDWLFDDPIELAKAIRKGPECQMKLSR